MKTNDVQYAQKYNDIFVRFVNTYGVWHDIIINVKTPNTLYIFLLHPIISEIPSPKRTVPPDCPFYLYGKSGKSCM